MYPLYHVEDTLELDLSGRIALVTGGGRGIGRAVALAYAAAGADVVVAARTSPEIDSCAEQMRAMGRRALAVPTDVGDPAQVDSLFDATRRDLGEVDILVNNAAGPAGVGDLWEIDPDDWRECMRVNLDSQYLCARAALPSMVRRRGGKIIMVGSGAGRSPATRSNLIAYGVAKAAVHHMSAVLANSVKRHGICVNAVGVSAVTRLMHDHRSERERIGDSLEPLRDSGPTPDENVPLFLFLASSLSDHVTGQYLEANSLSDSFKLPSP